MSKQRLIGIIIVFIGIWMLANVFRFALNGLIAPLVFFFIGYYFYTHRSKLIAFIFFIISGSIIMDQLFSINFIGVILAALCFYYGAKYLKAPNKSKKRSQTYREKRLKKGRDENWDAEDDITSEIKQTIDEVKSEVDGLEVSVERAFNEDQALKQKYTPIVRKSFIGDIQYMDKQFELSDVTIWHGIGTVKMDISKAIIPEGETVIIIQGGIGQIDVYVPEGLEIAVQATCFAGEMSILHEKHSGVNLQMQHHPGGYKSSKRRVKLVLSVMLGEVTVRMI
ncbi:cell wall-active antibiotics response protein LiaF [Bacillus sp. FJAT-45037]|uniref:cell wall-active antibiotics response protein LiaF n=1 Tax=Bacillus sp. FJAT-45037 TaxID=2011007 RepID=UPI000C23534B|nr:cell wall-active antibiotics response protein LiaF [Bacillus sp. FJAT-45037]